MARNFQKSAQRKLRVFVSYARRDLEFADRLVSALEARNIDVIIDRRDLPLLEEWQRELLGFIRQADAVVYILSPTSVSSKWCAWEVEQVTSLNKRLAPVLLAELPADAAVPEAVAKINYLSFAPPNDFETQADKLAQALGTDLGWLKEHTRLGELARRWDERGRPPRLLLPSGELEDSEKWAINRPREAPQPTELHLAYVQASRRNATRRQRLAIAGALGVAALAIGLASVAIVQRNQAKQQADRAQRVLDQVVASANRRVLALSERQRAAKRQQASEAAAPRPVLNIPPEKALTEATAHIARSRKLLRAEDTAAAEQAAQAAVELLDARSAEPHETQWLLAQSQAYEINALVAERLKRRDRALHDLATSQAICERLLAQDPQSSASQDRLADVLSSKADVHLKRKEHGDAERLYRQAIDIRTKLLAASGSIDARVALLSARLRLGHLQRDNKQSFAARDTVNAVRLELEDLARTGATTSDLQRTLSIAYHVLADLSRDIYDRPQAVHWARQDIDIAARLAKSEPDNLLWQHDLATSYDKLGRNLTELSDPQAAHAAYSSAIEIGERLAREAQSRPDWQRDAATTLTLDGELLAANGRAKHAVIAFRRALQLREQLAASQEEPFWQEELEDAYRRARTILLRTGRSAEALETAEQQLLATSLAPRRQDEDPANAPRQTKLERVARALGSVCWTALFADRVPRAVWACQTATTLMPDLDFARLNYAHALMFSGEAEKARQLYVALVNREGEVGEKSRKDILKDFAELEQRNVTHPQMALIKREISKLEVADRTKRFEQ